MDSLFRVLITIFQFVRLVALGFALYGLVWLPRFQNGMANGPHWLLYLYDGSIPILLMVGILGIVVIFVYNFLIALIPGQSSGAGVGVLRGLLIWIVGLAFFGGLPSFVSQFSHMQEVAFNDDSYHLIQRATNANTVEYFVYRCADPMGVWCERVTVTNDLPAPPPTPVLPPTATPTETSSETAAGEERVAVPDAASATAVPAIPTSTPPAELIDSGMGELVFQIGEFQMVLTQTQAISPTMTPLP